MVQVLPRYVGKIQEYAMFSDADRYQYGAVLYELKDESIPNNELNAALLGAEMVQEYCFEKSERKVKYFF